MTIVRPNDLAVASVELELADLVLLNEYDLANIVALYEHDDSIARKQVRVLDALQELVATDDGRSRHEYGLVHVASQSVCLGRNLITDAGRLADNAAVKGLDFLVLELCGKMFQHILRHPEQRHIDFVEKVLIRNGDLRQVERDTLILLFIRLLHFLHPIQKTLVGEFYLLLQISRIYRRLFLCRGRFFREHVR